MYRAFETKTEVCPKEPLSSRFETLGCLKDFFAKACIPNSREPNYFQVADYPFGSLVTPSVSEAWAAYPVNRIEDYAQLFKFFLQSDYNASLVNLNNVREELSRLVTHLPPGENKPSWPIDVQPPLKPLKRYDIAHWQFLNASHIFFTDEYTTVKELAGPDLDDLHGVTRAALEFLESEHPKR